MKHLMNSPSCWGCGDDWRKFHKRADLISMEVYGQMEHVCPDCFEELPEDATEEAIS